MRILKYVVLDILKNKIVIVYAIILALFSWSAFSLEDNSTKGLLTVLNIILLTVPLVSVLFATIYVYNSNEFIELLVSHPVKRSVIWKALFLGMSVSMVVSFIIGAGIPLLIFADAGTALMMIVSGSLLSVIFVAVAFLSGILSRDKAKGIGVSIMLWLYFALLFDGLVLFIFSVCGLPNRKACGIAQRIKPNRFVPDTHSFADEYFSNDGPHRGNF